LWAQGTGTTPASPPTSTASQTQTGDAARQPEEEVEISAPGADAAEPDAGEIVVTGSRTPNVVRRTPQVVSVLSAEDIARTGEGDIAGALQRRHGLSVVGNGFVFVRGSATAIPLRCSTARLCRAPSRCAASCRSTSFQPA
jgi:outer membrane receptor protein involved in Fe transport